MDNILVRVACSPDLPEILALYKVLLDEDIDFDKAKDMFERIITSDDIYLFIAEVDGIVVGTIQISLSLGMGFNCRPFVTVEYLVVDEKYRNRGIGSALLHQIDVIAEKENCAFSFLVSSDKRKDAHRLYYKCGYIENVVGFRKEYKENDV
jgi:GNAT superfamily N-acetyltransferase